METLFFTFSQNNSGGYFIQDDEVGLAEYVIVEEQDSEKAFDKLSKIVDSSSQNAWDYCSCCGERWYNLHDEGDNVPSIYGEPVYESKKGMLRSRCYIHLKNGDKQLIELKDE